MPPSETVEIPVSPLPFILQGFLRRPEGTGRSPAVVLLPVCGKYAKPLDEDWGARISPWGYVTLTIDSFGPRGIGNCGRDAITDFPDLALDAYRGLNLLIQRRFVDPRSVAVVGFAWGALQTFSAVERGAIEKASEHKFRAAAAAFYPLCSSFKGIMTVPTLILIGERDDWGTADACRRWSLAKMTWGFPDRRAKVPRFGSSSIPTRTMGLIVRFFGRRPSISGITWSSTSQPRINRAKRSVNFSTQQLGAVSNQ